MVRRHPAETLLHRLASFGGGGQDTGSDRTFAAGVKPPFKDSDFAASAYPLCPVPPPAKLRDFVLAWAT
jgi:hypothetical protein